MPIIENSEYENKVVVITGAGNGLGRAHAIEYAKRGAKIVINDLGGGVDGSGAGDAADQVVDELIAMGAEAVANKASVSDPEGAAVLCSRRSMLLVGSISSSTTQVFCEIAPLKKCL
jgi:NAD(P)-dependent dehydrogenase (short-subunit alcohol dehydrogenase family)